MMTSARPMAMSRSRVQTRNSLRREFAGIERSGGEVAAARPEVTMEDDAGSEVSGGVEVASGFSSELSIFGCLVFIACPSQPAPDGIFASGAGSRRIAWIHTLSEIHKTRPCV